MDRASVAALATLGYDSLVTGDTVDTVTIVQRETWCDLHRKVGGTPAVHFAGGVPLVAIDSIEDPRGMLSLQNKYWNFGRIPLLLNAVEGRVRAYAAHHPARQNDASDAIIGRDGDSLEVFARGEMDVGRGLSHLASLAGRNPERVDSALLTNIRVLRGRHRSAPRGAIETMLGGALLVRYMEDRGILDADHMDRLCGYDSLHSVLGDGIPAAIRLFDALAERFNGDVFGDFGPRTRDLAPQVTADVAGLLAGDNLSSGQMSLWPYDFEAIPTILVSSIYEELLNDVQDANGAHYTPPWLIDLVLDEILPWEGVDSPVVVDPACGSGAFLAAAYNRLLARQERSLGRAATFSESIDLLRSNIFGFEIDDAAASISIFGLYLTLLERQDPHTVWNSGRLPTLSTSNILTIDAFDAPTASFDGTADVIVGNPPWRSDLPDPARAWLMNAGRQVADQRLDQAFLWRSHTLLRSGGRIGMVLPHGMFVNTSTTAQSFRDEFFDCFDDRLIIDLSDLRNTLFTSARVPAAALCTTKRPADESGPLTPPEKTVISARNHPANTAIDGLILAPRDITTTYMTDGYRSTTELDSTIIDTLRRLPRLDRSEFSIGRGFQRHGGGDYPPDFLADLPYLPRKSIGRLTAAEPDPPFTGLVHRRRQRSLYRAPFIAVGRSISFTNGVQASYIDRDCSFDDTVLGVGYQGHEIPATDALHSLLGFLLSDLVLYWHMMTGSTMGSNARRVVGVNEYSTIPNPGYSPEIASEVRRQQGKTTPDLHRLNELVYDSCGVNDAYRSRIAAVVEELLSAGTAVSSFEAPTTEELQSYQTRLQTVLVRMLEATCPDLTVEVIDGAVPAFTTVAVGLTGRRPAGEQTGRERRIRQLHRSADSSVDGLSRVVQQQTSILFDEATVYLVKPAEKRFWRRTEVDNDVADIVHAVYSARRAS